MITTHQPSSVNSADHKHEVSSASYDAASLDSGKRRDFDKDALIDLNLSRVTEYSPAENAEEPSGKTLFNPL